MLKFAKACGPPACLVACSAIPNVQYNYYFAKSQTSLSVAQTITCDPSKQNLIVVTTASPPTTAYSVDVSRGPQIINIRDIEGDFHTFVDSDATFGFYDDGRLKRINQSTTGQGESVIKSAVSLATTALSTGLLGLATVKETDVCKVIDDWGGSSDGSPAPPPPAPPPPANTKKQSSVNLSYATQFDITHAIGKAFEIPLANSSKQLHTALADALHNSGMKPLPVIQVSVGRAQTLGGRASYLASQDFLDQEVVRLRLQRTADIEIKILSGAKTIWKGTVIAPMGGTYSLPIPRAALFGKQNFSLTLSEAGAVQSIDYGKLSGAAGALNAAQSVAMAPPQITTNEAADVKAKADLIAQTQRLLRCQTHPSTCQ